MERGWKVRVRREQRHAHKSLHASTHEPFFLFFLLSVLMIGKIGTLQDLSFVEPFLVQQIILPRKALIKLVELWTLDSGVWSDSDSGVWSLDRFYSFRTDFRF